MIYEQILYDVGDGIATITLNRPEKLNAFSADLVRELDDALEAFDLDPDAWVAILSGNGRCFSAGADVRGQSSLLLAGSAKKGMSGAPVRSAMAAMAEVVAAGRPKNSTETASGVEFLTEWLCGYDPAAQLHCHLNWHLALFELDLGDPERALARYEPAMRPAVAQCAPMATLAGSATHRAALQAPQAPNQETRPHEQH